jgi:hypothetical protein
LSSDGREPSKIGDNQGMEFEVIKVGVIATVLIVGATSMIPIAVWLDYKFRDKLDRLLDRR